MILLLHEDNIRILDIRVEATCLDYRNLYAYYPFSNYNETWAFCRCQCSEGHIRPDAVGADILASYKPVVKIAHQL